MNDLTPLPWFGRSAAARRSWAVAAALTIMGAAGLAEGAVLDGDDLFHTDRLHKIEIDISPADWRALSAQSRDFVRALRDPANKPFTYFKGDVTVNGVRIESVGVRKKGFIGSLDERRPSLKIKFDAYVDQAPVNGLDRLTLNNNKQDGSLMSQYLAYRTFRKAGLPAPRCSYAQVIVNGDDLGVYCHVESIRKPFLKAAFGDGSGALFEGTLADFYPKAIQRLEAKNDDSEAALAKPRRLAELLAADATLDERGVAELVDVPGFLKYWAVESLIGFWDGYSNNQNNYFVYDDPGSGKLRFIPWGADGAFDGGMGMARRMGGNVDATAVYAESMLANRLYHAGDLAARYRGAMRKLLDRVWDEKALLAEIQRIGRLVGEHLHARQSAHFEASRDQVRDFIGRRRERVVSLLAEWPAWAPATPRKPMYAVEIGKARGRFETVWGRRSEGAVELQMTLNGEGVALKNAVARAGWIDERPFGRPWGGRPGRAAEPRANLVISGVRESDDEWAALTLMVSPDAFESGLGQSVSVDGWLTEGRGFGRGGPRRALSGQLTVAAGGVSDGDAVRGDFELVIVETRGGLFGRRRR